MKLVSTVALGLAILCAFPQVHALPSQQKLVKKAINITTKRNFEEASLIAQMGCDEGLNTVVEGLMQIEQTSDVSSALNEVGLILGIVKYVDPQIYSQVRDSIASTGSVDVVAEIFIMDENSLPCNQENTVADVLLSSF